MFTKKNRIEARSLILILSSAVFIAFVAVVGWIYYFGSSGTYLLHDVLISPETLERSSFASYEAPTKGVVPYTFDKIEFVTGKKRGLTPIIVTPQAYSTFYKWVAGERSLPVITEEMKGSFNLSPDSLTIFVRLYGNSAAERVFQQIQFIEASDLFRIQPLSFRQSVSSTDNHLGEWIYFRYPGIYEHVLELFAGVKHH